MISIKLFYEKILSSQYLDIIHIIHIYYTRFKSDSKSFFSSSLNRAGYPEELAKFIRKTESVSTSGNKSKGEDMDACLEEVNKDSKVWQHGTMTAMDWLRIFRNLENLTKVG